MTDLFIGSDIMRFLSTDIRMRIRFSENLWVKSSYRIQKNIAGSG